MKDNAVLGTMVAYLLGVAVDWAYWIAVGVPPLGPGPHTVQSGAEVAVFAGFFLAPFWPIHVLVELWKLIL